MTAVEECYRGKRVRVFRLNREAVVSRLETLSVRMLEERREILEIRLFGSLVKGNAGPGSDADVLVVLRDATKPFVERIPDYSRYLEGAGIGCDVFPYTQSELNDLRGPSAEFAQSAWRESRLLASRAADGTKGS